MSSSVWIVEPIGNWSEKANFGVYSTEEKAYTKAVRCIEEGLYRRMENSFEEVDYIRTALEANQKTIQDRYYELEKVATDCYDRSPDIKVVRYDLN